MAFDKKNRQTITGEGPNESDILELHERDMCGACFDPEQHPKPPTPREEGVTNRAGDRLVDMQRDTESADVVPADPGVGFDLQEETPLVDELTMGFELDLQL